MALYKTYQGSFVSRLGHTVRCEIWREASKAPATVGELDFPYESPLTIEWDADSKRETIQGSTATLTVISPGDRTYIDLYTTVAGSVQLRVYRDNASWWRGCLDTEHYEEPFSMQKNYDVTFTFTDFGILDRLKYDLVGTQSIDVIIKTALSRANTTYTSYTNYINTSCNSTKAHLWTVRSDNFTDEDGETSNWREVLEGILQPLDLHMRQYAGKVVVFDQRTIAGRAADEVIWEGNDQMLAVDEVFNSVKVTFSPYADKTIMESEKQLTYTGKIDVNDFDRDNNDNLFTRDGATSSDGATIYAWYPDYGDRRSGSGYYDYANISFGLYLDANKGSGYIEKDSRALVGKFVPILGSEETTCIMLAYQVSGHTAISQTPLTAKGAWSPGASVYVGSPVAKFGGGVVGPDPQMRTRMKLKMQLLYDVRYNFASPASDDNTKSAWDYMADRSNATYIPVAIVLKDGAGNITHHYRNLNRCSGNEYDQYFSNDMFASSGCGWVEGAPTATTPQTWDCWLSFYQNTDDRARSNPATDGFTTNRHAFGVNATGTMPDSFKARNEGEILVMPPTTGKIEVWIYRGVLVYDYNQNQVWGDAGKLSSQWLDSNIRWYGFTAPSIELVSNNLTFDAITSEDIEYRGTLIDSAQDEIRIDTICGSAANVPGARGIYMLPDGTPIETATRQGRTDTIEQLLIGTIHSHYASRHIKLTGTMRMPTGATIQTCYDNAFGTAKKFCITSATCDLRNDEMEATIIETNADTYTSV